MWWICPERKDPHHSLGLACVGDWTPPWSWRDQSTSPLPCMCNVKNLRWFWLISYRFKEDCVYFIFEKLNTWSLVVNQSEKFETKLANHHLRKLATNWQKLIGGCNPSEKYAHQIGNHFPQGSGWKLKKYIWKHHLVIMRMAIHSQGGNPHNGYIHPCYWGVHDGIPTEKKNSRFKL